VRAIRERGRSGLVELGITVTYEYPEYHWRGHFETLICRGCGFCAWYAHGLGELTLPTVARSCHECGHRQAYSIEVFEHDGLDAIEGMPVRLRALRKGFPKFWNDGWFAAHLCCQCNRVEWSVRELSAIDPDPGQGLTERTGACQLCKGQRLWHITPIREVGPWGSRPLGVDYDKKLRPLGTFATEVCRTCGFCEWWAHELDSLEERPEAGIVAVDKEPPANGNPSNGPYR
jgi:hypothetical protein